MDTWLHVTAEERDRRRHRWLSVLKSRGMAHSNQVHEFRLTDKGVDILAAPEARAGASRTHG
jgi:circadian clock protein KaiC